MSNTFCLSETASLARFERAAFRLGGERSILLSYSDLTPFSGLNTGVSAIGLREPIYDLF